MGSSQLRALQRRRGKLSALEERLVGERMLFHLDFIKNIQKHLADVRKGWESKESAFAKEKVHSQASRSVSGSELA